MFRSRLRLFLLSLAALLVALVLATRLFPDFGYTSGEFLFPERFHRYDQMITEIADRHQVDPALVKAVVWRESKFRPGMEGTSGERGLMQVGESAAAEWAKAEKMATFVPTDLFDPKTNIEAGTWYLAQALRRWKDKDDAIPFALAEYNAGRTRVDRWIAATNMGEQANADDLLGAIDYPTTRRYIDEITRRAQFYRDRGRL